MKSFVVSAAVVIGMATASAADPPNLLINGDFEVGGYACGFFCAGSCNVVGWTALRVDYLEPSGLTDVPSGNWGIDLNQCTTGWLYQDIPTIPGRQYQLRFYAGAAAGICSNSPALKRFSVGIGSSVYQYELEAPPGSPAGLVEWHVVDRVFTADHNVTRVRFDSLIPGCAGIFLDAVSVVEITDCNGDGIHDVAQCRDGSLPDYNSDNVPDCCESGTPCEVGHYSVQWRVQDGGNGHWYAFVRELPIESLPWTVASERSADVGGYLACVQSSAENDFLWTLIRIGDHLSWGACGPRACGPFLGGYRTDVGDDPALGWRWVDGSSWGFTRWAPTEPANGGGVQNYLKYWFDLSNPAPDWGDDSLESSDAFFIEWSDDCNGDGYVDFGQILLGELADVDQNGVPDSCEPAPCPGDVTRDGVVDGVDLAGVLGAWGAAGQSLAADVNDDELVEGKDLAFVLSAWGPCVVVPAWATLIEAYPNPAVVHDSFLRAEILGTGLAWRVRDTATQIEMVLIPPGTYQRGCSPSVQWGCYGIEQPVHAVTLTQPFYMGRYEVTQAQWTATMGSNPSWHRTATAEVPANEVPNRPVEWVSWNTIQGFLSATGMRLPTEAEWEYAYRAGTTTAFHAMPGYPNGTNDDTVIGGIAWFESNWGAQTRPVGQKASNGFGLHDMAGNVWEWVNDWLGDYSSAANQTNPTGPGVGSWRVFRGGSCRYNSEHLRASRRYSSTPTNLNSDIGFRVARNP